MSRLATLRVFASGPTVPAPMRADCRHLPTLLGKLAMERWVFMSRSVDARLKTLAQLRAASRVGCMW